MSLISRLGQFKRILNLLEKSNNPQRNILSYVLLSKFLKLMRKCGMSLLLDIPEYVAIEILLKWCESERDVCCVDTAVCNCTRRPTILQLFQVNYFVLECCKHKAQLQWMFIRNIKLVGLILNNRDSKTVVYKERTKSYIDRMTMYAADVHWLMEYLSGNNIDVFTRLKEFQCESNFGIVSDYSHHLLVPIIAKHCQNLRVFVLNTACDTIDEDSIIQVIEHNPQLEQLLICHSIDLCPGQYTQANISSKILRSILRHCKLKKFKVNLKSLFTVTEIVDFIKNSPQLEQFDCSTGDGNIHMDCIVYDNIKKELCVYASFNYFTQFDSTFIWTLYREISNLRNIRIIGISGSVLTDAVLLFIVDNNPDLREFVCRVNFYESYVFMTQTIRMLLYKCSSLTKLHLNIYSWSEVEVISVLSLPNKLSELHFYTTQSSLTKLGALDLLNNTPQMLYMFIHGSSTSIDDDGQISKLLKSRKGDFAVFPKL